MSLRPTYPNADLDHPNERQHRRQMAQVLAQLNQGKLNCVLDVTLASSDRTLVVDPRLHPLAVLLFDPLDEAGQAALQPALKVDADGKPLFDTAGNPEFETLGLACPAADRQAGRCTLRHRPGHAGARLRMVVLA